METHTTNYQNTFITVADDCPVVAGEIPPMRGDKKSVANIQFELVSKNPYRFTSDDVLFQVYAERNDLTEGEWKQERKLFFSKGQPCLRASPLTKRYGWGVHSDSNGKIAIYGRETEEYAQFVNGEDVKIVKAMKSSR
ncbi:DUF6157 family protein [Parapedobacter indicus]|uniref:Uncharacterized protein n=1 Tax=Parapedobacter indicus TaxID=1477437 RepID=A0A1I3EZJ9_9SPHI|nr:DUF6157 family protein [Parapedobacter indicus]PPL03487.1 hypothetical protein CLV26_10290 [Parapedobacter indicus]SFI04357.1 hypothetical protein SAMN05444682_10290 [Parapedobacter indicus]